MGLNASNSSRIVNVFHDGKKKDVERIKTIIIIITEGNSPFAQYNISGAYLECVQGLVH